MHMALLKCTKLFTSNQVNHFLHSQFLPLKPIVNPPLNAVSSPEEVMRQFFSITSTHKHEYCYWSTFRPWSSPCKKWTPLRVMMVRQKWNLKMVESQTPPNISSIFHSHCCHCHGTGILEDLGRQISAENIHQKVQCLKYGDITAQMGSDKLNVGSDKTHVGQW